MVPAKLPAPAANTVRARIALISPKERAKRRLGGKAASKHDPIKGSIPGAEGDYVVIRESKKRPKGWKPPVVTGSKKKAGAADKKPAAAAAKK